VIERFLKDNNEILIDEPSYILGNNEGKILVVLIINITCEHCMDAFLQLGNLVLLNDEIRLQIFIDYEDTQINDKIMSQFLDACQLNSVKAAFKVYSEWKNGSCINDAVFQNETSFGTSCITNKIFFKKNNISSYPTILLNNKVVPSFINFAHIKVAYS
jgi:thiol-disulfide isomerase/thioredoxin